MKACHRHKCDHDQATQVGDLAVCDLCGRECEAWGWDVLSQAVDLEWED